MRGMVEYKLALLLAQRALAAKAEDDPAWRDLAVQALEVIERVNAKNDLERKVARPLLRMLHPDREIHSFHLLGEERVNGVVIGATWRCVCGARSRTHYERRRTA